MNLKIIDMDHKGCGIGKINNKIIFIPKSIIGDICDIEIIKSHKNYDIGKIIKISHNSELRNKSLCPYYEECGGCNISNLSYQEQLKFKVNKVKNIFKQYMGIDIYPKIIGSNCEYKYRNKITYHVDKIGNIGLVSVSEGIKQIDECMLVSDNVNKLYKKIKENNLTNVEKIMIKECDNGLILSIYGNMDITNLKSSCLSIYINNICVFKNSVGYIKVNNIKYQISNKSFFQINTQNIENLYNEICRYGDFNVCDKVIDLYCGVGSISLYIAKYVNSVLGIEIIEDAIKDARENAKLNKIENVNFLCGDVSKLIDENISGDKLIIDPPRIGLDNHSIEVINSKCFKSIIYVSCNPMTLVRDIKKLSNYHLKEITLVDMFPQTHHAECVSVLHRKTLEK